MEHAKWPCAHPLDYGEKKRLRRYIFMFMIYIYIFLLIYIYRHKCCTPTSTFNVHDVL